MESLRELVEIHFQKYGKDFYPGCKTVEELLRNARNNKNVRFDDVYLFEFYICCLEELER